MPRPWPRKPKKSDGVKPMKPKPWSSDKEGLGTCSECKITNGHRAGCWKAGT